MKSQIFSVNKLCLQSISWVPFIALANVLCQKHSTDEAVCIKHVILKTLTESSWIMK